MGQATQADRVTRVKDAAWSINTDLPAGLDAKTSERLTPPPKRMERTVKSATNIAQEARATAEQAKVTKHGGASAGVQSASGKIAAFTGPTPWIPRTIKIKQFCAFDERHAHGDQRRIRGGVRRSSPNLVGRRPEDDSQIEKAPSR